MFSLTRHFGCTAEVTTGAYHTPGGALLMEIIRQVTGNVKEQQVCELQPKVFVTVLPCD